jgi:hypothetical protein
MRGARYVILVLVTVSVGVLRELLLRIKKGACFDSYHSNMRLHPIGQNG